ncbi:MAG: zinc-binding dehydrogenase [Anaerolineae bacterium]
MKALMKVARGEGQVEVRDIAEPTPPPGHVTLAVRAAGICGTDLHIYHDEFPTRPPVVMGHEVAGEVVELGEGVTRAALGDRVTSETYFSTCGRCRYCRAGQPNLCLERRSIGSAVNGGFTRYLVVPERNLHRLPDGVDDEAGALTEPLACVVHGALEMPSLTPGDLAVIAGPGAIGLLTLQVVRAAGARTVVLGTDADAGRLALARQLGADHVVNVQREDPTGLVMDLGDGFGADIVYECSGAGAAAQQLLGLVRRRGQYAQIGLFSGPVVWDLNQICYKELRVTGSNASVPSAWDRALRLMATGQVQTAPLISHVFALDDWRQAFDTFERREGVKLIFRPEA